MEYSKLNEENGSSHADPPPPYSPPAGSALAGFQAPPPAFGGPGQMPLSVTCECCGFSINTLGVAPNTRVVQCTNCHQYMAIGPPPAGKKYTRCSCKKLLHCSITATKVSCPRCKVVSSLTNNQGCASAVATPVNRTMALSATGTCRIICAYCSQVMLFAPRGIARCPKCRRVSSVGRESARYRASIYFLLAFIFLGGGIGVTVGTFAIASAHGGYYYMWTGAYISGLIWLLLGIRYAVMRVSYPEGTIQA